jgi:hypothetical protein
LKEASKWPSGTSSSFICSWNGLGRVSSTRWQGPPPYVCRPSLGTDRPQLAAFEIRVASKGVVHDVALVLQIAADHQDWCSGAQIHEFGHDKVPLWLSGNQNNSPETDRVPFDYQFRQSFRNR